MLTTRRFCFLRWALFIAWVGIVLWLSLTPSPPTIESDFFGWDKFHHVSAYGLFTLLAGWSFADLPLGMKQRWRWAVIAAVAFGGVIEVAQAVFTKTRTAEFGDLAADLIGALFIYGVVMMATSCHRRK